MKISIQTKILYTKAINTIHSGLKPPTMKTILTILAFSIISISHAQFVSEDDQLHFTIGAGISSASYALIYSTTHSKKKAFWYSLGLSTLAGFSKEFYDGYIISGRFDTGEAIATFSGGLVASYSINIFTGKRKKKKKKKKITEDLVV